MIQVQGILVDPLNQPSGGTTIRVEALSTEVSIDGMVGETVTGMDGSYSFSLVLGDHLIDINFSDEYKLSGEVRVDGGITSPITLPALLKNHKVPQVTP